MHESGQRVEIACSTRLRVPMELSHGEGQWIDSEFHLRLLVEVIRADREAKAVSGISTADFLAESLIFVGEHRVNESCRTAIAVIAGEEVKATVARDRGHGKIIGGMDVNCESNATRGVRKSVGRGKGVGG